MAQPPLLTRRGILLAPSACCASELSSQIDHIQSPVYSTALIMNRRQFLSTVAGAAVSTQIPSVFAARAAKYDLIVKGGRVIDPSGKLNAVRDVAISKGRIEAVDASITGDAVDTIDARGKLVV